MTSKLNFLTLWNSLAIEDLTKRHIAEEFFYAGQLAALEEAAEVAEHEHDQHLANLIRKLMEKS
jgi:hypothetical protein